VQSVTPFHHQLVIDLMTEIKLVVFDLAGTTVQDGGQVLSAFTAALAKHHIEVNPEDVQKVRGASKREALLSFVPEGPQRIATAERIYASFRECLAHQYKVDGIQPVHGAEQVFGWLKARGIRVALNTGFDRDITRLLLTALSWGEGIVDAVICGDDVRQGRPAPYLIFHAMEATGTTSVQQVVNVGDTVMDLQAGQNAGVRWNVGVLSGAHSRQQLERAAHTHLRASVAETPSLWDIA
jgi:phosphonatase-like hydrolase